MQASASASQGREPRHPRKKRRRQARDGRARAACGGQIAKTGAGAEVDRSAISNPSETARILGSISNRREIKKPCVFPLSRLVFTLTIVVAPLPTSARYRWNSRKHILCAHVRRALSKQNPLCFGALSSICPRPECVISRVGMPQKAPRREHCSVVRCTECAVLFSYFSLLASVFIVGLRVLRVRQRV